VAIWGTDLLEVPIPYIRPIFQAYVREYPHKIWSYMVQYLHFRILKFPLIRRWNSTWEPLVDRSIFAARWRWCFLGKSLRSKKKVDFPGFTIFKKGNASISMGQGFHGYVTNSQRVPCLIIHCCFFCIETIGSFQMDWSLKVPNPHSIPCLIIMFPTLW